MADQFNMAKVRSILKLNQSLKHFPQIVHVQKGGDIFVFPSGTVVSWNADASSIIKDILPAAENPHEIESEDLEYNEDSSRSSSFIKGETITLGTKSMDSTLAMIAFSSGLARSAKLAVLESSLEDYFQSTRSIPPLMSSGSRLPFTRSFVLRKTGQLLQIRAQLNLHSELTDSLPDIFWDSRHELGLEGYYDQVSRALDVAIRIKTLNEKIHYAQEIASVLREQLSERHGLALEWMIIALITIEVGFEVLRLLKE
jgi:uncharacterized Rmd1/YagE family protein